MIETILITNRPDVAAIAEKCGVARIMVDLETLGKNERQAGRGTFISTHKKEDIAAMRAALDALKLMVRVNPWGDHSISEIDYAIQSGADILMLPMIENVTDWQHFADYVAGRALALPLIETPYAAKHLPDIMSYTACHEIYIGLNDLSLAMGMNFVFEPLAGGLVDALAKQATEAGKSFGFGGIAAIGGGKLPAERILGEHARLGSSRVILSSQFGRDIEIERMDGLEARFKTAMERLHDVWAQLQKRTPTEQKRDTEETFAMIHQLTQK